MWCVLVLFLFGAQDVLAGFSQLPQVGTTVDREWSVFYSTTPEDFTPEAKTARFPHVYQMENQSNRMLGPPANFTVTCLERELIERGGFPGVYYPGLTIRFTTPASATEGLRGFELRLKRLSSEMLLVLDFTGVANLATETEYTFDVFPLTGLAHYRAQMTSLPVYDGDQSTGKVTAVTGIFGHNKLVDERRNPADWSAAMRYSMIPDGDHDNTWKVEVVFSRPPETFGFERFELALIPKDHSRQMQKVTTNEFAHLFTGVKSGDYKLMLKPADDHFSVYGRCLCRLTSGTCTNCVTTEMETFYVG